MPTLTRTPPAVTRSREPLVLAVALLVATDLLGGLVAVLAGVDGWGQAWGNNALLAAPVPMITVQVLLAALAVRLRGRGAAVAAVLLAVACVVSAVAASVDGTFFNDVLAPPLVACQLLLAAVTAIVVVVALRRAAVAWAG